ncbi:MAG: hypothetical protein K8I29_19685 [Alphaproteobacteria bacterium]|uniref:Uncharacterized protein n=1 Tax=Candidatus Nitrobium versatile TaxID=2884831 RepID=A0A953SH80_9BACT|nr:hypothetical protein [Candidatus Nitrobium versatile]
MSSHMLLAIGIAVLNLILLICIIDDLKKILRDEEKEAEEESENASAYSTRSLSARRNKPVRASLR